MLPKPKRQATRAGDFVIEQKDFQKKKRWLITTLLLVGGLWSALHFKWLDPLLPDTKIESVEVYGTLPEAEYARLSDVVSKSIAPGFFRLDMSDLRSEILSLSWVKETSVRRVWPKKLLIRIFTHKPSVIWNKTAIITDKGQLIEPELSTIKEEYPLLIGPEGKWESMWRTVLTFEQMLTPVQASGITIKKVEQASRGAFEVELSNGVKIYLGTRQIEERLSRFVLAYEKVLKDKMSQVAYVDCRYTNGLAVGWRSA